MGWAKSYITQELGIPRKEREALLRRARKAAMKGPAGKRRTIILI